MKCTMEHGTCVVDSKAIRKQETKYREVVGSTPVREKMSWQTHSRMENGHKCFLIQTNNHMFEIDDYKNMLIHCIKYTCYVCLGNNNFSI